MIERALEVYSRIGGGGGITKHNITKVMGTPFLKSKQSPLYSNFAKSNIGFNIF